MTRTTATYKKGAAMCVVIILHIAASSTVAEPDVPCFFIFGDSLTDNGGDNHMRIPSPAKSLPYGIDFPTGPTGRYSNGRTIADVIGELLGFDDFIPPYASAGGNQILRGVNYASAAAGIRPESGRIWPYRTYFGEQVKNFNNTVAQITAILGDRHKASNYLAKCIYLVEIGANDFINNYFLPKLYPTSHYYSIPQFTTLLIQQYSDQLRVLYEYGARKFALNGLMPFGCSPYMLASHSPDGSTCVEGYSRPSRMFNKKLIALVDDFNTKFRDARYIYINAYDFYMDAIDDGSAYGFKVTNAACCGKEVKNVIKILCDLNQRPCENRDEYLYWDFVHPTEAASKVFAKRAHRARNPSDAHPFDINTLAHLRI